MPNLNTTSFQWYEDGTEAGSVAIENQDGLIYIDLSGGDSNILLRVRVQNDGTEGAATDDYQLQYDLNDSGTYVVIGTSTIVDNYSESNSTTQGSLYSGDYDWYSQSFTGDGNSVSKVQFYVNKTGSPTGNAFAQIYAHSGTFGSTSTPTGAALATSNALDVSTLTGSLTLTDFNFASPPTTTAGTKYCVVIKYEAGDVSNCINVGLDNTSSSHAGNPAISLDGSSWVTAVNDICFYVYSDVIAVANYNSASLTDGNATTNRLGAGTGSFVAGEISEDGLVDDFTHTANNYTEHLFALTLKSTALSVGNTLNFRLLANSVPISRNKTPRIVIGSPPSVAWLR